MSEGANHQNGPARNGRGADASENGAICVLLARSEPPPDLLESLRLRSVSVIRRQDAFGAMTEVIRLAHSPAPLILLVLEPESVPRAEELARSVERYAAHAVCWRFDARRSPALRGFTPPPEAPTARVEVPSRRPAGGEEPRLRLTGEGPSPGANAGPAPVVDREAGANPRPGEADESAPDRPADLLTEAELAMLLSNDFPGQAPGKPQGEERR